MSDVMDRPLIDPKTFVDGPPHAYFDYLRREDPVHYEDDPRGGRLWSLTRYNDIRNVSMDKTGLYISSRGFMYPHNAQPGTRTEDNIMYNDGPRHQRLRGFMASAFSPRVVAKFDEWIREICVRIVREIQQAGSFDAIPQIAAELPAQVIASILGVPEEDRHNIYKWATDLFGRNDPAIGIVGSNKARTASENYAFDLREQKRSRPTADMATELLTAEGPGGPITDGEYAQSIFSLMLAGFETTHTLIAQSLLLMARNPPVMSEVYEAPIASMRDIVEEMLRITTPVNHMSRALTRDTELHGKQLKEGDFVLMWYTAGNRDPDVFENPNQFNYKRARKGHLSFGGGSPHYCVGAHLARLEVEILFDEFRKADLKLELDGAPARAVDISINALRSMPMRVMG